MSEEIKRNACRERAEEISLFLWDELDEDRSDALELHLESCAGCRTALDAERRLLAAVQAAAPVEPPMELLTQCRVELSQRIEQAGLPGFWTRLGTVIWPRGLRWSLRGWMAAHPAFSAALLVMMGVALGGVLPQVMSLRPDPNTVTASATVSALTVTPADMNVTGIEVQQGASGPQMIFRGNRETPEVWRMEMSDPRALGLLVGMLQDGQRLTADTRMESVNLLQGFTSQQEARETLCRVARSDRNPALRLKAIEALKSQGQDEQVRQTILQALLEDENPGVRIEAVNALREIVESASAPDRELVRVLRERMVKDSSTYIRLQSAAAVRSLEQRGVF